MLTGTPLDLTPFGPLLSALGIAYWGVALALALASLLLLRRRRAKWPVALLVLGIFIYPVLRQSRALSTQDHQAKSNLEAAMALFNERCKAAGEKVARTVENVDGVVWMKWRERTSNADNYADQWKLNDPYGNDCGAESCIEGLLRVTAGAALRPDEAKRHEPGYGFVETIDPRDGKRYRYTAHLEQGWSQEAIDRYQKEKGGDLPPYSYQFKAVRTPITQFSARYGITWEDISSQRDREHWIAGGSLRVVDLQTEEVVAERVGYMVDQGQGSQAGFRSPWIFAQQSACPEFPTTGPTDPRRRHSFKRTLDFVTKALQPMNREPK